MFSIEANYKEFFSRAVAHLSTQDMPVPWRIKAVDDLIEAYVKQVGEVPDGDQLEWQLNTSSEIQRTSPIRSVRQNTRCSANGSRDIVAVEKSHWII
ncbi:hypothetical protein GJ688_18855 [Heliobacillus mobilis]|uniref:Uncharacterized protein n=1 Tax=Heliobacterium mobile TaxID=28064 RepID=A0A6I3SPJ4_HELMO|nr:hypothetical protein [Heliobacterium mobile]